MDAKFEDLKGKILTHIQVNGSDEIIFTTNENKKYRMHHYQNCCESVSIDDICGELDWLLNSPILRAEERTNSDQPKDEEYQDSSFTWTFYEICTLKGSVTIRWYGSSNGYYSESVDFEELENE